MIEKQKVCGLLLAAGSATRMGCSKLTLPLADGRTVLEHAAASLLDAGIEQLVVVLGGHQQSIRHSFCYQDRVLLVENPRYKEGMFTSIQAGLDAICKLPVQAFMLQPGDMPFVPAGVVDGLCTHFDAEHDIVIPAYQHHKGHPALFSLAYAPEILQGQLPCGMKSLLERHQERILRLAVDGEGIIIDLDTPEDYQAALSHHQEQMS